MIRQILGMVVLATATACVGVEADVPSVCMQSPQLTFVPVIDSTRMAESFVADVLSELPEGLAIDVRFNEVTLTVVEGTADLSFIREALVSFESFDPGSGLPKVDVVNLNADSMDLAQTEISIESETTVNLKSYAESGALKFDVAFDSQSVQPAPITLQTEICISGSAQYSKAF